MSFGNGRQPLRHTLALARAGLLVPLARAAVDDPSRLNLPPLVGAGGLFPSPATIRALASLYLGGVGAFELARAGQIEERTEGTIARADALFRTDRAPWCAEIF